MSRLSHDTAFAIASALTERMDWKLKEAERAGFHKLVYETCKGAIEQHDVRRDRERKSVGANLVRGERHD